MSGAEVAPETTGVAVELLATVDLGPEIPGMEGRRLRMRMVTMEPGGVFGPVHDHRGRPGTVYVLEGTITDHRDGTTTDYGPGPGWPEDRTTLHWLENRGTVPAVEVSVDVVRDEAVAPVPALDSPRWEELTTRRGPGARWVADFLTAAARGTASAEAFTETWPELCSEGTTYDAAYAAAPHLVAIAEGLPAAESVDYLIVLGLIETHAGEVPADLEPGYRTAVRAAQALSLARLADCPADRSVRYLLAAVAAFRGRADLASVLQDLDAVQETCGSCGAHVFPAELQRVVERDRRSG